MPRVQVSKKAQKTVANNGYLIADRLLSLTTAVLGLLVLKRNLWKIYEVHVCQFPVLLLGHAGHLTYYVGLPLGRGSYHYDHRKNPSCLYVKFILYYYCRLLLQFLRSSPNTASLKFPIVHSVYRKYVCSISHVSVNLFHYMICIVTNF